MKKEHIAIGIAGIGAAAVILIWGKRPTVKFVPHTIYRGDPVTATWGNFDDGVLGVGKLYTSLGLPVYTYESYEGSGSKEFSGSLTEQLIPGEYTLIVVQESVNKSAQTVLTVLMRPS